MPRIRATAREEERRRVVNEIRNYMNIRKHDSKFMAGKIGKTYATYNNKLTGKQDFTLPELIIIAEVLKIPKGVLL